MENNSLTDMQTLTELFEEYAELHHTYFIPSSEEIIDINPIADRMQEILLQAESLIRKEVIKELSVGSIIDADKEAKIHAKGADMFMQGFLYARNNLQDRKNKIIKE